MTFDLEVANESKCAAGQKIPAKYIKKQIFQSCAFNHSCALEKKHPN